MSEMISLLCPTRGRPDFMEKMYSSAWYYAKRPQDMEVIWYIDDDDDASIQRFNDIKTVDHRTRYAAVIGPRICLSETWNKCFERASGDIFMHCGDDVRFTTWDWDVKIRQVFDQCKDKIIFMGGPDGFHKPESRFITHGFLHRNWVETVGYFVPPYFVSDYNDTWLNEVSEMIGRKVYLNNFKLDHLHPVAGKHHWDRTHLERLDRHRKDGPGNLYAEKGPERQLDARKLMEFMEDFKDEDRNSGSREVGTSLCSGG